MIESQAEFSADRKYRYWLSRIWNANRPLVLFIGLNPSTANGTENDNTISKIIKIAQYNDFGGLYMQNLFAIVSKDPEILKDPNVNPHGDNHRFLQEIHGRCERTVFAWGAFPEAKEQAKVVKAMYSFPYCIKQNKDGSPAHPLYQLDKSLLKPYIL